MRDFYRLHARTRRRHGLPPQPFSFFSNIHSEVIKPGLGFVVLAKNASKVVAGAVFFYTATRPQYLSSLPPTNVTRTLDPTIWSCGKRFKNLRAVTSGHFTSAEPRAETKGSGVSSWAGGQ